MATKYLEAVGAVAGDCVTELTRLKGDTAGNVYPILFDAVDGSLKWYDRVNSVVRQLLGTATPFIQATAATLAVTAALHAGRTICLNRAAGIAVTLPAATGSGNRYRFVIQTTFTGAASIAVANANDYMIGLAQMGIDGGTLVPHQYPTANTGTVATESDTISLFGTANSQGGFKGAIIEVDDIAANIFLVNYCSDAGGTEATPFSVAV